MDVEQFRKTFRELRKRLVGSQAALSALTKNDGTGTAVNVMTISEIETGKIANPSLFIVARLIEAMPSLTLSSFFAQLEEGVVGGADSTLQRQDGAAHRHALRADILHDIGNAIIASAGDVMQEAATAHRRAARRGAKTRRSGR